MIAAQLTMATFNVCVCLQYELCENKSVASMNTADKLKLRLLMNNYRCSTARSKVTHHLLLTVSFERVQRAVWSERHHGI